MSITKKGVREIMVEDMKDWEDALKVSELGGEGRLRRFCADAATMLVELANEVEELKQSLQLANKEKEKRK